MDLDLTILVETDAHLLEWDRLESFKFDSVLSKGGFSMRWDELTNEVWSGR